MRKILTSSLLLAAGMLTLASCSSSDDLSDSKQEAKGQQFIAVNIQNVGTTPGTRAGAGSGEGAGQANSSDYLDGNSNENNIKSVRFYFFGANGAPVNVNAERNYIDWTEDISTNAGDKDQTIERVTTAHLVLNNYGGALPTKMTAIVNPDGLKAALGDDSKSLTQLQEALTTTSYGSTTDAGLPTDFAMTPSVYDKDNIAASTDGKIKSTEADATADPVDIYVERVAARVQVKYSGEGWTNYSDGHVTFRLNDKPGTDGKPLTDSEGHQYYAVVYGWGLADEQANAYDVKNLAESYTNLGINNWFTADYHRSFWETIPTYSRVNHAWSDYTGMTLNGDNVVAKDGVTGDKHMAASGATLTNSNIAYTLPNTPTAPSTEDEANRSSSATNLTKIVVAARIVKQVAEGQYEPATIVKIGPNTYASLDDAKKYIAENSNLYKVTTGEGNARTVTKISADDIDFKYSDDKTVARNYEGTATLKDQTAQYATGTTANNATNVDISRANTIIGSNKALIYTSGLTYYYTSIRHLGAAESYLGYFGVVRNHIYDITVTGLYGLGTPVYNPDDAIIPETVTDQNSYLAARVNVLQWRVVSQSVDLDGSTKQNQ